MQRDKIVGGQKQDDSICRRFLDCFQQCILCLLVHFFRLIHNIHFVAAAVWFYHNIVIDLGTDIVHPDGIRLFVGYINDIGLIMIHRLFAGAA